MDKFQSDKVTPRPRESLDRGSANRKAKGAATASALPSQSQEWRIRFCLSAAATVAISGIGAIVTLIALNYAGWPDIVNNVLRGFNVHVTQLDHVPFWQSVTYIVILSVVVLVIVREFLQAMETRQ